MSWELVLFIFLFGAIWGSFLNVLIYRMPRNEDIVFKRSHCPQCKNFIPWYFNLPLMGFLILRGRCKSCKTQIPWRYPLVEFITGLGCLYFVSNFLLVGQTFLFLFYFAIFCSFLVHFFIDLEHNLLLDKINLFLLAVIFPFVLMYRPWDFWLLGGLIGFGVTYFVTWAFYLIRGQIGLGGGDIKLFGLLGLLLGPIGIVQNIFLSCFLGSIVGVALIISGLQSRDSPIPFGPFIIIVASFQVFMPAEYSAFGRLLGLF